MTFVKKNGDPINPKEKNTLGDPKPQLADDWTMIRVSKVHRTDINILKGEKETQDDFVARILAFWKEAHGQACSLEGGK